MKNEQEILVFTSSLRRKADPGTVCSVVFVALPQSNGWIRFCVFRHPKFRQLVAGYQGVNFDLLESSHPTLSRFCLELPDAIVRFIRWKLRQYDIRHIEGVIANNEIIGRPVVVH